MTRLASMSDSATVSKLMVAAARGVAHSKIRPNDPHPLIFLLAAPLNASTNYFLVFSDSYSNN